ncbi:MAG: hypothetical protein HC880_10375 [Bacteroidia bacterium]|nr:hypothetical protein [Bacteroidia bacterium]
MKKLTQLFYPVLILAGSLLGACQPESSSEQTNQADTARVDANPAAEGFNEAASDLQAIAIADEIMQAMGGRKNWDNTRLIRWNFFGLRTLYWDKQTGDVRIDFPEDSLNIMLNVNNDQGKVYRNGQELTDADSLQPYLSQGKSIWINDSYWLVMPYKMKDSGVTLKYLGTDTTLRGDEADLLQLTFENVGDTPQNKYKIYVDKEKRLVSQWAYFKEASQDTANFVLPWLDYQKHGNILLSGNRDARQITDIQVRNTVPEGLFTSLRKPEK